MLDDGADAQDQMMEKNVRSSHTQRPWLHSTKTAAESRQAGLFVSLTIHPHEECQPELFMCFSES